jgi:hypothetical protein
LRPTPATLSGRVRRRPVVMSAWKVTPHHRVVYEQVLPGETASRTAARIFIR